MRFIALVIVVLCSIATALAAPAASRGTTAPAPRYTFSWPLDGTDAALQPRGGTTRGAPVEADDTAAAWNALQQPDIDDFERDRRAIRAMAGTYRVTFDFLETVPLATRQPARPYQSWGTEKIYVDRDDGHFISLLHILEMHVVGADGSVSAPIVVKHWRQDWQYQPATIVEFVGNDRWQRRTLQPEPGQWLQTVYQVDESPRYASVGRWQHTPAFSSWLSNETWRPLPRREWTVRDDYHALIGTNRHTITANGWVQEENNLKAVLTANRLLDPRQPYLAREYGVARYDRIRGTDFAAADRYFACTRQFWSQVRDAWTATFERNASITLAGASDKLGLFAPLFARADQLAQNNCPDETMPSVPVATGDAVNNESAAIIRTTLGALGVPQ